MTDGPKRQRLGTAVRTEEVEVFSDAVNASVVRTKGRRFPGVVIQGDTLSILHASAWESLSALRAGDPETALEAAEDLEDHLRGLLEHYQSVLAARECDLPFVAPVGDAQRATKLLKDSLLGIVRIDDPNVSEYAVTIKELVATEEAANAEVERLSATAEGKGTRYVVQSARVVPPVFFSPGRRKPSADT
jgi:hypothetical protein